MLFIYCKNCGTELKEDSNFCSKCGSNVSNADVEQAKVQKISNEDKTKSRNIVKIMLLVGIIIVLVAGVLGVDIYRNNKLASDIEAWYEAYESNQYDVANEIASNLDDPYKSYYLDYISFAIELDDWAGTDEQLCSWLEKLFVYCEEKGYADISFPDSVDSGYCVWAKVAEQQEVFEEQKDYILDAIIWQPEYCNLVEEYYTSMYEIMWKNRELLQTTAVDGLIWIPVNSASQITTDAFDIYNNVKNELQRLEYEYTLNQTCAEMFEDELKKIEEAYTTYMHSAVEVIEDSNEDGYILLDEVMVLNKYEQITELYNNHAGYIKLSEEADVLNNLNKSYFENKYNHRISPVAYALHDMIDEMFSCEFKISNAEWVEDAFSYYEEIFQTNAE